MTRYRIVRGRVEIFARLYQGPRFHAILSDPPYGLNFMGRNWDHGVPSSRVWSGLLSLLRPGSPILAYGGTRTFHRLTVGIEDGGAEIRDVLMWLYGQGFPKSHDISKAIDKAAGTQKIVGYQRDRWTQYGSTYNFSTDRPQEEVPVTAPGSPDSERWNGYGTALKPAWEPVVLAMKPRDGTFAHNALQYGTGGLNIDGSRIQTGSRPLISPSDAARINGSFETGFANGSRAMGTTMQGRWPANLLLSHTPDCVQVGTRQVGNGERRRLNRNRKGFMLSGSEDNVQEANAPDSYGTEEVGVWDCAPDCPVRLLDDQSGDLRSGGRDGETSGMGYHGGNGSPVHSPIPPSSGGASRFFYCAKASRKERDLGLPPGRRNSHPTVKPIGMSYYLARLLLPPPGPEPRRILVPYSGSGSEVIGALLAGWDEVMGVEMGQEHAETSRHRIDWWLWASDVLETSDPETILQEAGALQRQLKRAEREGPDLSPLPLFSSEETIQ